ncbi:MAG TPA: RDD family protein [Thermoanaerobaculia bacterium]
MRFDEVELEMVPLGTEDVSAAPVAVSVPSGEAPRLKRLMALLTDLSLFAALVLALSPLLPQPASWLHIASLAGFVVVLSYYYFAGTWMLWGKTIGGAIFDVRVVPEDSGAMSLSAASTRWAATYLSLALGGLGFMLAALPSRRSLPDRMSNTKCV